MTAVIVSELFATVHVVGIIALIAMLWHGRLRGWFEQRCVGGGTAIDLAWIRIVACSVLILYIFTEDLTSLVRFEPRYYDWPGYLIHLRRGVLRFFVESAPHLKLLTGALVGLLVLGLAGIATRVTIPLATVLYVLYAALLRSFGKYFHDGYLVMYVMIVLSFMPAGDAWSFDAWLRKRRGKPTGAAAYPWMVWACFAALCLPYLQLATSKLVSGGLFWFDGRSLRNYMVTDDLNLTEWNFDLALRAIGLPTVMWTVAGFFALASELVYPFVLVFPRLRRVVPYCVGLLHVGVWLGQDALFLDAIMMPLAFLMPSRWFAGAPNAPASAARGLRWLRGAGVAICLVVAMLAIDESTYRVTFRYQWPLEGWQMYAGKVNLDPRVHYRRFVAHYPDGRRVATGLGPCAAFLEKPYRLDFGLVRDLPGFLTSCAKHLRGADALTYETRTWAYQERSLAEHLSDPPDTAFTVALIAEPPAVLRRPLTHSDLLACPDFEQVDRATGIPRFWIVAPGAFVGLGVDPATGNHSLMIAKVPIAASPPAAPPQTVRQQVAVPASARGVAASILARTTTAGAQLALELDGKLVASADVPPDGAWHRVETRAALARSGAVVVVVLAATGDTYFDDAVMTADDPPRIPPAAE